MFLCMHWLVATVCEKKHGEVDLSLQVTDTEWLLAKREININTKVYMKAQTVPMPLCADILLFWGCGFCF